MNADLLCKEKVTECQQVRQILGLLCKEKQIVLIFHQNLIAYFNNSSSKSSILGKVSLKLSGRI